MSRVHKLERQIDQKVRQLLRSSSPEQTREPLELYRSILDEVASRIDAMPRGRRAFVYSHVRVRVLVPDQERFRPYELLFTEADPLARDIKSHFEDSRVEYPARFTVDVELVYSLPAEVSERGFEVVYSNPPSSAPTADSVRTRLTILVGNAQHSQYEFTKRRINIGRLAEVVDADMRTLRRNDIALTDDSTIENSSVSRAHAHLEYDPDSNRFRLFDDGSARGTIVVRGGSAIPVPQGKSKGVLLEQADEINLGQVKIGFGYGAI